MIYVHIPFCHHKCSYCAFFSVAGRREMDAYVEALCAEMRRRRAPERSVRTVYFGGGTPSRLGIALLQRLVGQLRVLYDFSQLQEATIEANPEDLTTDFLRGLRSLNFFNRISIGIQSFADADLRAINRVHNGSQALEALQNAHEAGFTNVSIDLMMGLPGQSIDTWRRNLDCTGTLLRGGLLTHLSCYELSVEPGTILERQLRQGRVELPDEETVAAEYELLMRWCHDVGMEQYEVSNFALPGLRSVHNSRYWRRVPYLGLGAGAHSFDGSHRRWNLADIAAYVAAAGDAPHEQETLSRKDAFNEFVMTALRTTAGIDKSELSALFPWAASHLSATIAPYIAHGLIVETAGAYVPSPSGLLQADAIAASLFL